MAEHLSTIEDVAMLEILYDQVQPLQISYDLTSMTIFVDPVIPLTINVPSPFPYKHIKTVSCIYDSIVYIHGEKVQDEPLVAKEPAINITGTWGVARSEIIFVPVPHTIDNGGTSSQGKVKQIEGNQHG